MEFLASPYFPIFIAFVLVAIMMLAVSGMALLLGPKKPSKTKLEPYECGIPSKDTARTRLAAKYYLTAILFILFDIETVFLYLWAISFDQLAWFGVIEVGLFIATLLVGYIYIIKRDALRWE
jgi:NADH-quinone oxidoreductase subunit A